MGKADSGVGKVTSNWDGTVAGAIGGSSSAASTGQAGVASTGTSTTNAAKPVRRASTFQAVGGRRAVKAYPLTEAELTTLGLVQGGSALMFTLAGGLLGTWFGIDQQIAFADKSVPKVVLARWGAFSDVALWAAAAFGLVAVSLFLLSTSVVRKIKRETDHA